MEIVIATTTALRAQEMQRTLIGHTMSGEDLEQRPQVQFRGAADFLGAAMRIYEITAIRLVPKSSELLDVIAAYRPMVWRCEACGSECRYPGQLRTMSCSEYHCWCDARCRAQIKERLDRELKAGRTELGCDPITAVLDHLLKNNTRVIPKRLQRLLTESELGEVNRRFWAGSHEGLVAALIGKVVASGAEALLATAKHEDEQPSWQGHEYWQGERRLGYLIPKQGTPNEYHCLVDRPGATYPTTYIGTYRPLIAAKKAIEQDWKGERAYQSYLRFRYNGILLERDVQPLGEVV